MWAVPLWGRAWLGPHLTQFGEVEAYHRIKWHLDTLSRLATTDMGRKWGAAVPLLGQGS